MLIIQNMVLNINYGFLQNEIKNNNINKFCHRTPPPQISTTPSTKIYN